MSVPTSSAAAPPVILPARLAGPLGWRAALRFKGRLTLSGAVIAIGVALGYAIHLVNAAAIDEFARGLRALSGTADLSIRGSRSGFDAAVFARVARLADVVVASPVVEVDVRVLSTRDTFTVIGVDALRASMIAPGLVGESAEPMDLFREDALFVTLALAAKLGRAAGDTITVQTGLAERTLRIAGLLGPQAPEGLVGVMDIAAAQLIAGSPSRISRIDVRLRTGASVEQAVASITADLPPGVAIERPEAAQATAARLSRAYRINLTVLALVALFTGSLLVFATEALAAARRRAELALLRVLGMTERELLARLLRESLVLGAIGSAAGLLLGAVAASVVVRYVGPDLGAGFFRGVRPTLALAVAPAALFFLCGIAAAVLGALLPALEASRATPASALKAGSAAMRYRVLSNAWPALALLGLAIVLVQLPPVSELPIAGYAAIGCGLLGTIAAMPAFCVLLLRVAPRPRAPSAWLARQRLARTPVEVAISLAPMVAAVSLTVSMVIMVASFRDSLITWLDRLLPADLYVRTGMGVDSAFLGPDDQARIAATPGVRRVEFLRADSVVLDPHRPRVTLLARDLDQRTVAERLPLLSRAEAPADALPVWVSEVASGLYDLRAGERFDLALADRRTRAFVAGVWRDYGRMQGAIVIERARYVALTGDRRANDAALWLADGAAGRAVPAALEWLSGRADFLTPGEIKALSVRVFDRTFAVTYGLEAVAILIGMAGLSAGVAASVTARRREFGVLRHLGMTRGHIVAMLASEGAAAGLLGVLIGCLAGWLVSLVLVHVVNRQSFHWSMELQIPVVPIIAFGLVLVALAAVVAVSSGAQAMRGDAVRAVRDDW
jgi:putative ABC transport system permease protein